MTEIVFIDVHELHPLEKNPRKITKSQFEKLCKNLENDPEFFTARPCLVNDIDGKKVIFAGNQRYRAAKKLSWDTIPCIVYKDLDEEIQKKRIVLDNLHHGEFDFDILANSYDIDELLDLGFLEKDLHIEVSDISSEEEGESKLEPKNDSEAITKLGDVYELNNHRLVCGDSTNPDIVSVCLNNETPILMVTDPPYGVSYDPSWREGIKGAFGKKIAKGKVKNDEQVNWSLAWHLFPGSVAYVWHASKYCSAVQNSLEEAEFEIINQIIWVKQHFALSRGDYHWQHEPCWYAVKKGCEHNWQGSRKESTIWEIANLNCFGKSKEDGEERTAHSTQKPIECMSRPIKNNTQKGEGVYDPFLGSGTTLIACEQLERSCYGIELSPGYCDIIVDRWINFMKKNGKKYSIKLNNKELNLS